MLLQLPHRTLAQDLEVHRFIDGGSRRIWGGRRGRVWNRCHCNGITRFFLLCDGDMEPKVAPVSRRSVSETGRQTRICRGKSSRRRAKAGHFPNQQVAGNIRRRSANEPAAERRRKRTICVDFKGEVRAQISRNSRVIRGHLAPGKEKRRPRTHL